MNETRTVNIGNLGLKMFGLATAVLVVGALLMQVLFGSSEKPELLGGIMSITTTRSCDFVTFEGKTYQVCSDGVIGVFTALEQLPFKANQAMSK
jgi:hypothetical protein